MNDRSSSHNRVNSSDNSSRRSARRSSIRTGGNSTRRGTRTVSLDEPAADNILDRAGSKYVKKNSIDSGSTHTSTTAFSTSDEEANALMPSANSHANDPLTGISLHEDFEDDDLIPDVFYAEEEEEEKMNRFDKMRNFNNFSDASAVKRQSPLSVFLRANKLVLASTVLMCLALAIVIATLSSTVLVNNNDFMIQQVPPAPSTLSLVCQGTTSENRSVQTVPETCQEMCNKAECCWNPDGNFECSAETQASCPAYVEPCAVMMAVEMEQAAPMLLINQMAPPPPPASLHAECHKDANGDVSVLCEEMCAQAECCWSRESPYTCTADSRRHCGSYRTVCSFLNANSFEETGMELPRQEEPEQDDNMPFPAAPMGMDYFCDPEKMGDNLGVCQEKCQPAECCWKDGVESCLLTVPDGACSAYSEACSMWNDRTDYDTPMETTTNVIVDNHHPVKETDSPSTTTAPIVTQSTDAPVVERPRAQAPTLETLDNDSNNHHNVNNFIVQSTATPPPAFGETPTAPVDLQATCSLAKLMTTTGRVACQDECAKAECCWVPEGNDDGISTCTDKQQCTNWSPCAVLIGVGDGHGVSATPAAFSVAASAPAASGASTEITNACNVDSGNFVRSHCHDVCQPGACCIDSTMDCEDSVDCSVYEPCQVLSRRSLLRTRQ